MNVDKWTRARKKESDNFHLDHSNMYSELVYNTKYIKTVTTMVISKQSVQIYKLHICRTMILSAEPWFNIKMTFYQCMKSHCRDKMVFPILVRRHIYIESGPRSSGLVPSGPSSRAKRTPTLPGNRLSKHCAWKGSLRTSWRKGTPYNPLSNT